jgi:hypothetical protein
MTTFTEQDDFWRTSTAVHGQKPSTEEAWDAFRRRNPWFMRRFIAIAQEQRVKRQRVSAKLVFEELRQETDSRGQRYQPNNDWTALAARLAVEMDPSLDGAFEFRERRS